MRFRFIHVLLSAYVLCSFVQLQSKQFENRFPMKDLDQPPVFVPVKDIIKHDRETVIEVISLSELFNKNNAQLAILVYDQRGKKYYVYDKYQLDFYQSKSNWYYVVIDNDQIPMVIGLTSEIHSLYPFDTAIAGNPEAQQQVGFFYTHGNMPFPHFPKKEAIGFAWNLKAAQAGLPQAQYNVAYAYLKGLGVDKNEQEAVKWLHNAVRNGYDYALLILGQCYEFGRGVKNDMDKAIMLYTQAAELGDVEAQYQLGKCYFIGKGVEQNYDTAYQWFYKAADFSTGYQYAGFAAQAILGMYHENGLGNIKTNEKIAREWYEKALTYEHPEELPIAANNLALHYLNSNEIDKANQNHAFELLNLAAINFDTAQINMGICHEYGIGTNKNPTSAYIWYQKAASQGNIEGIFNLGRCFFYSIGTQQNYQIAKELFDQTIKHGHGETALYLGLIYEFGLGVEQNLATAQTWYKQAIKNEIIGAKEAIARCNQHPNQKKINEITMFLKYHAKRPLLREKQWNFKMYSTI